MRANELRIGNWIYDPLNKTEFQIDVFLGSEYCTNKCEFDSQEFDAKIEECQPIPLTEGWLLKFGFELEVDHLSPEYLWGKIEIGNPRRAVGVYNPDNEEDWYMMFREDVGMNWVDLNEIQYVHQLQNLYFALTNEELTLQA